MDFTQQEHQQMMRRLERNERHFTAPLLVKSIQCISSKTGFY